MSEKRWAAVAGWPVDHSLSPLMHAEWLMAAGIEASYETRAVPPEYAVKALTALMADPACLGLNITLPHKRLALSLADAPDHAARAVGAANLLYRRGGEVRASNTDAAGFLYGLSQQAPELTLAGAEALVLGAGGAARAAVHALKTQDARVRVANRTAEKAQRLAGTMGVEAADWPAGPGDADLIVNATSLGLGGAGAPPVDLMRAKPGAVVYDLVYRPLETPLLRLAREAGLKTVDGLDMLIGQARPSFETFFGAPPPEADIRARLLEALGE